MEDYIKGLAAGEGWTEATTAIVLAGVLQELVDMGAADPEDLQAMIRRRGNVYSPEDEGAPEEGDVVHMHSEDVNIVVDSVPDDQPEALDGIWRIIDEYGEEHRIERESADDPWYVVIPSI